jgi:large subunit ribosomal protein L28
MSRHCSLTNRTSQKGNSIAIERSKVTKRTIKHFQLNLQKKRFKTKSLNVCLKVSNKTLRTIEYKDGLENFLLQTKRQHLSPLARKYRKMLIRKYDIKFPYANKN